MKMNKTILAVGCFLALACAYPVYADCPNCEPVPSTPSMSLQLSVYTGLYTTCGGNQLCATGSVMADNVYNSEKCCCWFAEQQLTDSDCKTAPSGAPPNMKRLYLVKYLKKIVRSDKVRCSDTPFSHPECGIGDCDVVFFTFEIYEVLPEPMGDSPC